MDSSSLRFHVIMDNYANNTLTCSFSFVRGYGLQVTTLTEYTWIFQGVIIKKLLNEIHGPNCAYTLLFLIGKGKYQHRMEICHRVHWASIHKCTEAHVCDRTPGILCTFCFSHSSQNLLGLSPGLSQSPLEQCGKQSRLPCL